MRSNSGLERFQRPSVSHSNLSAANFRADIGISPLKRLGHRAQSGTFRPAGAPIVEGTDRRFQSKRSPQVIMRVTKIENKIVAVAAREGFPVDFKSIVERETQDALVCPGCAKMFAFFAKGSNSPTMRV